MSGYLKTESRTTKLKSMHTCFSHVYSRILCIDFYFYNELHIKDRCVEKIIENNSKTDYRHSRDIFIFFTLFIL